MKKLLLTCPSMIPKNIKERLGELFEVIENDCAMSEAELLKIIPLIDVVVIGGEEAYSLPVVKLAKADVRFVFVGVQGDTSFTKEALDFIGGPEKILVTGGGLSEVARTTIAEIADYQVRKAMISQKTRGFQWVHSQEFAQDMQPLSEIEISVIGAGNIGQQVLKALDGKCKRLAYHDPFGENKPLTSSTIIWEPDLEKAFSADIVTLHLRLGPATERLIAKEHLKHVRQWLINNSRAGLVNEKDFSDYLKRGGRAIWDVFYVEGDGFEKLSEDRKSILGQIAHSPNFFFTAHSAAMSPQTFEEYGRGLLDVIQKNKLDQ